ncbi:MAG: hypothetical protein HQM12_11550 [SAR324 cluster bacterium]|nr:hypothetical protein [SAR324 cluster bacterium]
MSEELTETLNPDYPRAEGKHQNTGLFSLLRECQQKLRQVLEAKGFRGEWSQEIEKNKAGLKNYTPLFREVIQELRVEVSKAQPLIKYLCGRYGILCPDPASREQFLEDLASGCFREWLRYCVQFKEHEWLPFILKFLEKNALSLFQRQWLQQAEGSEVFLRFLQLSINQYHVERSSLILPTQQNHETELLHQTFEGYFEIFLKLFESQLKFCVQKWPESMVEDANSAVLELGWECYSVFLRYAPTVTQTLSGYVNKIIQTRSINRVQSHSPAVYQIKSNGLRHLQTILEIEIPEYLKQLQKNNIKPTLWIPEVFRKSTETGKPELRPKASARELLEYRQALGQWLRGKIMEQLRTLEKQVYPKKSDFIAALSATLGPELSHQFGELIASYSVGYFQQSSIISLESTQEDDPSGVIPELSFGSLWKDKYSQTPHHTNAPFTARDYQIYKQTFLGLLQSRPYDEQFLLKTKTQYKPEKRPQKPQDHALEHPQRISWDEILELARQDAKNHPLFYQWFVVPKNYTPPHQPEQPQTLNIAGQEFFPEYYFHEKLEQTGWADHDHELLQQSRKIAQYKVNPASLEQLQTLTLPNAEKLRLTVHRQFENARELLQFFQYLFGKEAISAFREGILQYCKLPKKEALQLRRPQTRTWAERIMLEMKIQFSKIHAETDIQVQDFLVILEDDGEWGPTIEASKVEPTQGDL